MQIGCAIVGGCLLLSAAPASATEVAGPTIDSTTVTNITEHGATLEAKINPHGRDTLYEIRLIYRDAHPPAEGEPVTGAVQSRFGRIAAGFADEPVSLALTGLQPGYIYLYLVRAGSRAGETNGKSPYWFGFHYSGVYPEGWTPNLPYEPTVSFWSVFSAEDAGAQLFREAQERRLGAVKEYEEKQRQGAKEYEEQQARETARIAAEAAALKRHEEQEQAAAKPVASVVACIVPSVKGDTLSTARRVLARHHCRLGRVGWPRRHHGALIVIGQTPRHGKNLAGGAAIAVTLGSVRFAGRSRLHGV